jgi:hypothetical protein
MSGYFNIQRKKSPIVCSEEATSKG